MTATAPATSAWDHGLIVDQAMAVLTIELYRRKDAPFGVTDAWSPDGVPVQLSSDPLQGVKKRLRSLKGRCGVG
jgi:hypothetical protein